MSAHELCRKQTKIVAVKYDGVNWTEVRDFCPSEGFTVKNDEFGNPIMTLNGTEIKRGNYVVFEDDEYKILTEEQVNTRYGDFSLSSLDEYDLFAYKIEHFYAKLCPDKKTYKLLSLETGVVHSEDREDFIHNKNYVVAVRKV